MALVNCPECNAVVSDKAEACQNCGLPISHVLDVRPLCPECGVEVSPMDAQCESCGFPLSNREARHLAPSSSRPAPIPPSVVADVREADVASVQIANLPADPSSPKPVMPNADGKRAAPRGRKSLAILALLTAIATAVGVSHFYRSSGESVSSAGARSEDGISATERGEPRSVPVPVPEPEPDLTGALAAPAASPPMPLAGIGLSPLPGQDCGVDGLVDTFGHVSSATCSPLVPAAVIEISNEKFLLAWTSYWEDSDHHLELIRQAPDREKSKSARLFDGMPGKYETNSEDGPVGTYDYRFFIGECAAGSGQIALKCGTAATNCLQVSEADLSCSKWGASTPDEEFADLTDVVFSETPDPNAHIGKRQACPAIAELHSAIASGECIELKALPPVQEE